MPCPPSLQPVVSGGQTFGMWPRELICSSHLACSVGHCKLSFSHHFQASSLVDCQSPFANRWTLTPRNTKMWSLWTIVALVVAVAIPVGVGFLGNVAGGGAVNDWYRNLNKPSWTPPDLAFPIIWTTLYILMGVSSWLVWKEGGFSVQAYPLGAYIFQLVLNFIWSPLFFRMHRIGHALVEIVILWLAIAVTIYLFFPVNAVAAYLLIPYIAWVTVATALNGYIWMYNGEVGSDVTQPLQSN